MLTSATALRDKVILQLKVLASLGGTVVSTSQPAHAFRRLDSFLRPSRRSRQSLQSTAVYHVLCTCVVLWEFLCHFFAAWALLGGFFHVCAVQH